MASRILSGVMSRTICACATPTITDITKSRRTHLRLVIGCEGYSQKRSRIDAAKRQYKPFTEADVTPDMIKPEILVYAEPHAVQGTDIANVEAIVVLPHNSKDASQAVHPTEMKDASQEYKNLLGFSGEGKGLVAIFPIDAWNENNDLRVVFDKTIPGSRPGLGACRDCKSRIYLGNVR